MLIISVFSQRNFNYFGIVQIRRNSNRLKFELSPIFCKKSATILVKIWYYPFKVL